MSIASVMPSSHLILWCPLLLLPQTFPASGTFPMSWLFTSDDQTTGVSASTLILQWVIKIDFPWDWLVWSPCCPKDSQESSPSPQFKSFTKLCCFPLYSKVNQLYIYPPLFWIPLAFWVLSFVAKTLSFLLTHRGDAMVNSPPQGWAIAGNPKCWAPLVLNSALIWSPSEPVLFSHDPVMSHLSGEEAGPGCVAQGKCS